MELRTKRGNPLPTNQNFKKATKNYLGWVKMRIDQEKKPRKFFPPYDPKNVDETMGTPPVFNRLWDECEGLKNVMRAVTQSGPLKYSHKATRQVTYYGLNDTGKERIRRRKTGLWKKPKPNKIFK